MINDDYITPIGIRTPPYIPQHVINIPTPQTTPYGDDPIMMSTPFSQIAPSPDNKRGITRTSTMEQLKFTHKYSSKKRRTFFSMFLSTGIFGLCSYILIWHQDADLRLFSVSLLSTLCGTWLSNLKVSTKTGAGSDNSSD